MPQHETVFLEHIRQNQGIIYRLVNLYAADNEEKKDFYQEVMLNAWHAWPSFKGNAKVSTWLYSICLRTILTQKRRRQPVQYQEGLEAIAPPLAPGINDDVQRLWQAIRLLPEADRAIISMHLDGYDNPDIAEVIGISLNHVSVKIHRIKQQIAKMLQP